MTILTAVVFSSQVYTGDRGMLTEHQKSTPKLEPLERNRRETLRNAHTHEAGTPTHLLSVHSPAQLRQVALHQMTGASDYTQYLIDGIVMD